MGLNLDIKTQLESLTDQQLRWWLDSQVSWLRDLNIALSNKERQIASANTAVDELHQPMPPDTLVIIEAGNKPIFHGFPDATDPADPNYESGLFQRIPDIEAPSNPIQLP